MASDFTSPPMSSGLIVLLSIKITPAWCRFCSEKSFSKPGIVLQSYVTSVKASRIAASKIVSSDACK